MSIEVVSEGKGVIALKPTMISMASFVRGSEFDHRNPTGSSLAPSLPRIPERATAFSSNRNRLGKVFSNLRPDRIGNWEWQMSPKFYEDREFRASRINIRHAA